MNPSDIRHRAARPIPRPSVSCLGRRRPNRTGDSRLLLRRRPAGHHVGPRYVFAAGARIVRSARLGSRWLAPELEFFLVEPNIDSDYPLKPPIGRSGRPEIGRQGLQPSRPVNEFDPLFDDMYSFCEAQDIEIDTLIHESGAAQMEIKPACTAIR